MQTALISLACLLGACAAPPFSTTPQPAHPPRSQRAAPTATLPFSPRATAARATGGLYVLGGAGELARLDRRGRLTGIFQTELVSLAVTRDFVCGSEASGRLVCARDHRRDATCASAELAPFFEVALPRLPRATLSSQRQGRALCLERAGQLLACVSGEAGCGRACLAFPSCAPPRCVDPCPPGSDR